MKNVAKVVLITLAIVVPLLFIAYLFNNDDNTDSPIHGAWYVDTIGAPFTPHLFAFHSDGTVHVTFPDAAEKDNSAGMGIGVWEPNSDGKYSGRFIENNADKATNKFTSNLIVTFTVEVRGNTLEGTAEARYYDAKGSLVNGPFPATLKGQRITLDSSPPIVVTS